MLMKGIEYKELFKDGVGKLGIKDMISLLLLLANNDLDSCQTLAFYVELMEIYHHLDESCGFKKDSSYENESRKIKTVHRIKTSECSDAIWQAYYWKKSNK
ncbi:hypothetical protein PMAC_002799 [Pneumocystis sp. 'macacae']|nr:hypothetical protein PMAC_002799 [Pneumocystis sp. 'macacae']